MSNSAVLELIKVYIERLSVNEIISSMVSSSILVYGENFIWKINGKIMYKSTMLRVKREALRVMYVYMWN